MKTHFSTFDIVCSVTELQRLVGLRVANVYDIDNKTYLIKLQKTDEKCVLLMESGSRFHTSAFEWPKNIAPSSFSMKMRKHLKNKRLESLRQLGMDRIVDFQFGMGEAAYHIILELYDRGNLILTDHEMTILNVLRPHTEGEKLRFAVKEKYPFDRARERKNCPSVEEFKSVFQNSKQGESLKKILNFNLEYGPAIIEHVLIEAGFKNSSKIGHDFKVDEDIIKLVNAFKIADEFIEIALKEPSKGYIVQKKEEKPTTDSTKEFIYTNVEFHSFIFNQHKNSPIREFPSFDMAVDEFFSTFEGQKIELRALHQEREALKKLDNVRKDHQQRLVALGKTQEADKQKAELITRNQTLVDNAIMAVQSAVANQVSWPDIKSLVKEAQENGDPVASVIKQLKLETNHITLLLDDPWANEAYSDEDENDSDSEKLPSMTIDIDLALSAFANARRYYDQKRSAAKKQQKTIESHGKALKSAEKKTKQTLKEVQTATNINKARKVFWFEKFFWFISSENYLVIGGRDQTQNELIVKRYMRPNDIYVHAEIHGASSIVIKNPSGDPVPPKTLNEAGVAAICYSVAWEAKVVTGAWWVNGMQVSKTAPTGEYLTTGSFMIRGKKNYLPPCQLSMGFGFLFKLEDGSIERHKNERCVRTVEEEVDQNEQKDSVKSEALNDIEEVEVELDSEDDDDAKQENAETENKNSESNTEEDEEEEDTNAFPDTHIKIEHISGTKINLRPEVNTMIQREKTEDSDNVIYLGDDKPVLLKSLQSNRASKSKGKKVIIEEDESKNENSNKKMDPNQKKRGQKGKLKKIKEKYKYQDEEERKLRMEILQSAGTGKDAKKSKKPRENATSKQRNVQQRKTDRLAMAQLKFIETEKVEDEDKDLDDEDKEEIVTSADLEILDSLTGVPDPEDELLFAVPVIAPYNSLTNYKYKIKITPGTGKKTKATRTAVSMFLRDKTTSTREKDLLRSVKDEIMTRNLPGKVKLSAPKLQSVKK